MRQAAQAAAVIAGLNYKEDSDVENVTIRANNQVADEATELPPSDENKVNEAEPASEIFGCFLCGSKSNWEMVLIST